MPNCLVGIYDYASAELLFVFKADSKADFTHSQLFSTHLVPNTIFWVTDKLTIYTFDTRDLLSSTNIKKPKKLNLPKDVFINEIQIHPTMPLIFAA
jgi:hypothetical protein